MKIIQILPELNAGGVEGHVLDLAGFLASAGHESIVISNGGNMVAKLEQRGVRHVTMPVHRKSLRSLLQVHKLRAWLRDEKPDIVHAHSRVPAWIGWLALRGMDPLTRPTLMTGSDAAYVSTTDICSTVLSRARIESAVLAAKVSAQSPPVSTKASPRAALPR